MPILQLLQRHRIQKITHATGDKEHARRLMAILLLHEGHTITYVHHLTGTARSTISTVGFCGIGAKGGFRSLTSWQCPSLTCRQDCHSTGLAHAVFSSRFWLSAKPLVYRAICYQNQSVNRAQRGTIHTSSIVAYSCRSRFNVNTISGPM